MRKGESISFGKGRNNIFNVLLFYAVSLLLSLVIVIISVTVFIVIIYMNGSVTGALFYLFIGIISTNLVISGVSLRGIFRTYPRLSNLLGKERIIVSQPAAGPNRSQENEGSYAINPEFFTEIELEIIDLLKGKGNAMLQNALVESLGRSKATTSRAIASLENKGVILKVRKGVTNEIILTETYST